MDFKTLKELMQPFMACQNSSENDVFFLDLCVGGMLNAIEASRNHGDHDSLYHALTQEYGIVGAAFPREFVTFLKAVFEECPEVKERLLEHIKKHTPELITLFT